LTVAVDVDYYAVLSIARDASDSAVAEAVKKAMRQWRKKTEAADLEARQAAEQMVKKIEMARATLTNPSSRQAYTAKLDREGVVTAAAMPTAPAGGTWLSKAKEYLGRGDPGSAERPRGLVPPLDGKPGPEPPRRRLVRGTAGHRA
jgi:DnaJ-class molecular chaperone